jgi:hypothetical protein
MSHTRELGQHVVAWSVNNASAVRATVAAITTR